MPELITVTPARERLDFIDWTLRILVALVFLYEGFDKFSASRLWATVFARIGLGQWFRYATGLIEVIGALLLLMPQATTVAVVMLAGTMIGAFLVHLFVIGTGPQTVIVTLLLGALLAIGWRRRARHL